MPDQKQTEEQILDCPLKLDKTTAVKWMELDFTLSGMET